MTDNFDQLFKEKVESKSYSYSAKAWRKFSKKAGFGGANVAQIVAIATTATAIIALGSYFLYQKSMTTQTPEPKPITITNTDSVSNTETIDTCNVETAVLTEPHHITQTSDNKTIKHTIEPSQSATTTVPHTDTLQNKKTEKKYILRPKNPRRILEINTDTIKSNE